MCWDGPELDSKELSRRLGDRGDLIACLTSSIGREVEMGEPVSQADVEELKDVMEEIGTLLDDVENRPDPGGAADRASAD